jgi:hypothetical protein
MIRTTAEYQSAIEFIKKDIELYDYELSDKMSSLEYNLYLQDTEYFLDFLYEKSRTIEDLIEYLEFYSKEKISKLKKDLQKSQKMLIVSVDKYLDKDFIAVSPEWESNPASKIRDRDGSEISSAIIADDNSIFNSGETSNEMKAKAIIKDSGIISNSDNISTCLKDDYYIAEYNLDKPQEITEILIIDIYDISDVNNVSFNAINCDADFYFSTDNKIIATLVCNDNTKEMQNWNYEKYTNSQLNNLDSIEMSFNKTKDIYTNLSTLSSQIDKNSNKTYFKEIKKYQETKDNQFKKSNLIAKEE